MSISIDRDCNVIVNTKGCAHVTGWVVLKYHRAGVDTIELARGRGYHVGSEHFTFASEPPVWTGRRDELTLESFLALTGWALKSASGNKLIEGHFVQDSGILGSRGTIVVTADGRDAETGYRLRWWLERVSDGVAMPVLRSDGGVWTFWPDDAAACARALGPAETTE
jgi:hypothetical protein